VKEESSNKEWVLVRTGNGNCGKQCDLLSLSSFIPKHTTEPILIEWHLDNSKVPKAELTPLAQLWQGLSLSPVIPYDAAERRKVLSGIFAGLQGYIVRHEQLLADHRAKKQKSPTEQGGLRLD
jgi:hypothetical protein